MLDSDSSSDCEELEPTAAPAAGAGARACPLPPYFAAIPSLAAASLRPPSAPQQPRMQPAPRQQQTAAPAPAKQAQRERPQSAAAFKKQRAELTTQLFTEFNRTVFEGRLPADLEIKWNARLLTTAGLTHYRRDIPDDPYAPPMYALPAWAASWLGGQAVQACSDGLRPTIL